MQDNVRITSVDIPLGELVVLFFRSIIAFFFATIGVSLFIAMLYGVAIFVFGITF